MAVIEIDGRLYRVPREVLERYEMSAAEADEGREVRSAERRSENRWYEIGEADCN